MAQAMMLHLMTILTIDIAFHWYWVPAAQKIQGMGEARLRIFCRPIMHLRSL